MTVFKNYFKIVKKHLGTILLFSSIAIGVSIVNTSYDSTDDYVSANPILGIINYDDSNISEHFVNYIEDNSEVVEIEDDKKYIQDALYNNKVDAILIIPDTFGSDVIKGNTPSIKIKKSIDNLSQYTELLVNRYIKIASTYSSIGMSEKDIISNIGKDVKKEVEVQILNKESSSIDKLAVYYSFENYAFLSIFIFIVGTIMCIFNKDTIVKRNNISKLKPKSISNQLFLGHIVLTLSIWFIFVIISIIIYKDLMFNMNGLLLIINSLCFAFTTTSLAYLIGSFIKNVNIISGIQNVVSLGLSFISGCFVPMEWLDKNIVNFSKIFPSYYFIKNNYDIAKLTSFSLEDIKPILYYYLVIIIFGLIFFLISRIILKFKSK